LRYDYDVLTIGLGPAGMAVSAMAAEMGLRVCAVERDRIGGECMNVGCIPSKALLRTASLRHAVERFGEMELSSRKAPDVLRPFDRIRERIEFINSRKTLRMFDRVDLVLGEGAASFTGPHEVEVGGRRITARRVFIATGSSPMVPPIPGLEDVEMLTNENVFDLDAPPESMLVLGGGAIGSEMAQAFSRLGTEVTVVHMDDHLLPFSDSDDGDLLQARFEEEGIRVLNGCRLTRVEQRGGSVIAKTDGGDSLEAERILVAAGRCPRTAGLNLEAAGVETGRSGIMVDRRLRTTARSVYAVGDVNGHSLFSHSAMHQGMVALMNCMIPWPFRLDFRRYVVPWTVFTEPQVSHVGMLARELSERGRRFETVEARYGDYGAAIAEGVDTGYVRAFVSPRGRVLGATVVGEGSGEMINEWALAIQERIPIYRMMMLQHSFPTMSFLSKRVTETWMMGRMGSRLLQGMARFMFRTG
jgi:pyruvate/2-oxoglutarate dehydrogenase complex dihydrolipoamide dehydrogenase (E3) component